MQQISDKDLEVYAIGEDAPQIVGVFDERPAELIAREDYKQSEKWKVLAAIDGSLTINNFDKTGKMKSSNSHGPKEPEKRFRKYDSDDDMSPVRLRDGGASPDASPVRRNAMGSNDGRRSKPSRFERRDDSPDVRRRRSRSASPDERRRTSHADRKESTYTQRSSGVSPPRKTKDSSSYKRSHRDPTPEINQRIVSPPRRRRGSTSPQRKNRRANDNDASPPRKRDRNSSPNRQKDNIASPPRRQKTPPRQRRDSDASPPRRRRQSDASPPRKPQIASPPRKNRRDSDASPPRRQRQHSEDASPPRRHPIVKRERTPDASPPRRHQRRASSRDDVKPPTNILNSKKLSRWSRDRSECPPPAAEASTSSKMSKTLDGKAAGLQDAQAVRQENDRMRKREKEIFDRMSEEMSGRNAEAVVRDRKKGGAVRDVEAEMEVELEKMRKEAERKAVYDRWGKG